ncbi:hypothetical protein GCM10011369_00560 [Neiella marina]|uniref:DUF3083 family protein n=1 Tax=Neiella marina TaxID=508461 RepID=A0A8J2U1J0_9GAMM|nr:DUF3083 family protein [Neiella marina]GGA63138.1 hypothetical protein GCM10011369_00560 [Neiella marina]
MLSRDRGLQHKVYIPSNARENQYLLAKFELTDELLAAFSQQGSSDADSPYGYCYQQLANLFFDVCDKHGLDAGQFIANDKFIRVRYCPEKFTVESEQQLTFLYSPKYHTGSRQFVNEQKRVRKIKLLFLATGPELRHYSAQFHTKVTEAVKEYSQLLELAPGAIRLCDHQHLTYDLFAKEKGVEGVQAHKLRSIANRFRAHDVVIDENELDSQTYAVINLHVNKRVQKLVAADKTSDWPYLDLYKSLYERFVESAKSAGLDRGIMTANDRTPVVRSKADSHIAENGELQTIDFNEKDPINGFDCYFAKGNLVDSIQFIMIASKADKTSYGYGKFISEVHQAMRDFADKIDHDEKRENLSIRVHQHIGGSI